VLRSRFNRREGNGHKNGLERRRLKERDWGWSVTRLDNHQASQAYEHPGGRREGGAAMGHGHAVCPTDDTDPATSLS
jgi:hypothetical protein